MLGKPSQRFRSHALCHDLRHDTFKLTFESTDPTVGKNDVGVKDFACQRVYSARSDRSTDVVVQPTDKVVLHIFRIEIHVLIGFLVLLSDNDRFIDSDLLERFVPVQNAISYPASVPDRSGVF